MQNLVPGAQAFLTAGYEQGFQIVSQPQDLALFVPQRAPCLVGGILEAERTTLRV
jgi:hypothetical protein